ncbi:MAG: helix-turn-helix domain-containing protein [Desulfobacula sp.]|uniref:helix-turn-helix domain-containing protein n=1 Tax=Desulfobacula sp. TaxID=2593537 RepID=UPI0025C2D510|nr:helix-turn-helix domain-containing protein [Desulfobacula sp.]MCD4723056.1 helix-turn-helix domain-containing protein [Desulfobacula sp.]
MIDVNKRKAIFLLHNEGMGIREISRKLKVSTNTVGNIIDQKGRLPETIRQDKINVDPELLRKLHTKCDGYVQRIHEILIEEEGILIGYSTLTRNIRELNLGQPKNQRCDQKPDEPGAEMQHDTSPYTVKFGTNRVKVVASIIYMRYSKMRYLKFYHSFNRFAMKCFIHEALTFWGYAAPICIIDNTNLARLRGTGKNAVMAPEMKQFAKQYGFEFICHEVRHSNRKAGNERSFYTVETNFFPGRNFETIEDMNQQAFDWATIRLPNRPVSKTKMIPTKAFEYEQSFLEKLPAYITPPYIAHERGTDQYGYAAVNGNFYWVPGKTRFDVKIVQFCDHLEIYYKRKKLAEYQLPMDGVKNKKFSPKGEPKPKYQPNNRKRPTAGEEKILRSTAPEVDAYLTFVLTMKGKTKHRLIRQLYTLHKKTALSVFAQALKRALKYRIKNVDTIENIIRLLLKQSNYEMPLPEINEEFTKRPAYLESRFADEADLSIYKNKE